MSLTGAPGVSLIRTKVHGPIARPLVPRPALVERLVHGPARRLTLIGGQAGWGKSSVLAVWSARDDRKFEQSLRYAGFRDDVERVRGRLKKGGPRHTIFLGHLS